MKWKVVAAVWGGVVLLAIGLAVIKFKPAQGPTPPTGNVFPQTHPLIDYPIWCEGDRAEEFRKRIEAQSGYHEPEPYLGTYQNLWQAQKADQKFNILAGEIKKEKYPEIKAKQPRPVMTKAAAYRIRNYLETVSYRALELDVNGRGYYFLDSGEVLSLVSKHIFTEDNAAGQKECLDNQARTVNLGSNSPPTYVHSPDMNFTVFTPQYCAAYSFLETSGDVFLICLEKKVSENQISFLLLGFAQDTKGKNKFIPVIEETWTENYSLDYFHSFYLDRKQIMMNRQGKYYLFTKSQIFEIAKNAEGYLAMAAVPGIPAGIDDLNISYPEFGNQISNSNYLFLSGFSTSQPGRGLVFDTSRGKFLKVDYDSCVVPAPESFYNETIDPFSGSSYKNLRYKIISPNHFQVEQSSSNAGCVTDEGTIEVYLDNESVKCRVKVKGDVRC